MIALDHLNTCGEAAFVDAVGFAFEHSPWIARAAFAKSGTVTLELAIAGVPMVIDYAKTPEQKEALSLIFSNHGLGWPYIMTSETPGPRAKAMQAAFDLIWHLQG